MRFSPLTVEQRQRRAALREAKALTRKNHHDPSPDQVLRVADYILRGEVPPPPAGEGPTPP